MDQATLSALDDAREKANIPFVINSSIRCEHHNKVSGGSSTSSHLIGCAVDIKCDNSADRIRIVTALLASPITRVGIANNFIHADYDQRKPQYLMWVYQ